MKTKKMNDGHPIAKLMWVLLVLLPPLQSPGQDNSNTAPQAANANSSDEPGLRLNFRDVPISMVLEYLSEAAGFTIIENVEVRGNVNVWNNKPLTKDQAVDLLDTILHDKGFAAVRQGDFLKIVKLEDANKENLDVIKQNDPNLIPENEQMVHQIIPVRYADAGQLVEDLQPLLPEYATLTVNETANAIILTDTQSNIKRMAEIIQALDTSISGISTFRVFQLRYSDAKEMAEVIKELFEPQQSSSSRGRSGSSRDGSDFRAAMIERMRSGGFGGRGGADRGSTSRSSSRRPSSSSSEARAATTRVVAVADERTNSLIVSASEDLMPAIEELIMQIDNSVDDITELMVFPLNHADATEMAQILEDLFDDQADEENNRASFRFSRGGSSRGSSGGSGDDSSDRMQAQKRVVAVADPRTNSVIVSAAGGLISQISKMIEQLDSDSSRKQRVYTYSLEHADVENVAEVLRGMFETQYGSFGNRNQASRNQRNNNNPLENRTVNVQGIGRQQNQNIR